MKPYLLAFALLSVFTLHASSLTLQAQTFTAQGLAVQGRQAWLLQHGGACLCLNLDDGHCTPYSIEAIPPSAHCNNAFFLRDSLLGVSQCYAEKACLIVRLRPDKGEVVHRILYQPSAHSNPPAQDWCLDPDHTTADSLCLYAYSGRMGDTLWLRQLSTPFPYTLNAPSDSTVLTDSCLRAAFPVEGIVCPQGSAIGNGYAYLLDGDATTPSFLHIVPLSATGQRRTLLLNVPTDYEPEGIVVQGRTLYVSFNTPSRIPQLHRYTLPRF